MIKIKICGVTNEQDALWAVNLGVDFIGLNFYAQSPRKISSKNAKAIVAKIPPFVKAVGLFVDEPPASIAKYVKSIPLQWIQLHGHETPEDCQVIKGLGVSVIKAFPVEGPFDASVLAAYEGAVDYFMFDHKSETAPGGTGEAFDWSWLQNVAISKPWFLAGGLKPENIAQAVAQLHPPMVDVCSGVERLPTRKDFEAMKTFIQNARSAR